MCTWLRRSPHAATPTPSAKKEGSATAGQGRQIGQKAEQAQQANHLEGLDGVGLGAALHAGGQYASLRRPGTRRAGRSGSLLLLRERGGQQVVGVQARDRLRVGKGAQGVKGCG